jgi:hypothetical protein
MLWKDIFISSEQGNSNANQALTDETRAEQLLVSGEKGGGSIPERNDQDKDARDTKEVTLRRKSRQRRATGV